VRSEDAHLIWRFLAATAATLAVSLLAFQLLLDPPRSDLVLMLEIFLLTGALSLAAVILAYRLPWLRRSPRIGGSLLAVFAFVAALTFFNVWLAARLMFISGHDFMVTAVLLLFAGGLAVSAGYLFSHRLERDVVNLQKVAGDLAAGHLETRARSDRQDELGALARSFDQMADQLQSAQARQQELERVRRDLLLWTGHDLRTPLTSVRVIVEALADGMVEDEETVARYLATARKDLALLSRLVEDLFLLAQLDAGRLPLDLRPATLEDVVSDTLESFAVLAERKGVRLEGEVSESLPLLELDVPRVGRALNNLVDNALRHTPEGGRVEVKVTPMREDVRVAVEDTGEGIPPEDARFVFEGLRRSRKDGFGLGLPLARAIVVAHGGKTWLEPVAQGSRFVISLPRPVSSSPEAGDGGPQPGGHGRSRLGDDAASGIGDGAGRDATELRERGLMPPRRDRPTGSGSVPVATGSGAGGVVPGVQPEVRQYGPMVRGE